jgi:hypothetical protein
MTLYCRRCAFPHKRGDNRTLSQKVDEDGVDTFTPVKTRVTDTIRGFSCQECGGLTGYALHTPAGSELTADTATIVSISEHPADRFK